jgi:hypothetical protein
MGANTDAHVPPVGETWSHPRPRTEGFVLMSRWRFVNLVALAVVLTFATTGTARAANWEYWQLDGDYFADAATLDSDGNGIWNEYLLDIDGDDYFDTRTYNTLYSDAFHEVREFDMDENDRIEFRLLDGDQLEGFDYVYADRDQNLVWDRPRTRKVRQKARLIIPGSNIDAINRTNRQNMSRDMMHRFTMATGQSLLYPSVTTPY